MLPNFSSVPFKLAPNRRSDYLNTEHRTRTPNRPNKEFIANPANYMTSNRNQIGIELESKSRTTTRGAAHGRFPHEGPPHGKSPWGNPPWGNPSMGNPPMGEFPQGGIPHGGFPHGGFPHKPKSKSNRNRNQVPSNQVRFLTHKGPRVRFQPPIG